jgi:hypothetical protein
MGFSAKFTKVGGFLTEWGKEEGAKGKTALLLPPLTT